MTNIRRYYIPDSIVFITSITQNRKKLFLEKPNNDLLFQTIESVRNEILFDLLAFVVLPDHFHFLIQMSNKEINFSKILQLIKGRFTYNYKKSFGIIESITIWQRRFWDHIIRDEHDMQNHLDYIHWNPVKHGYVKEPSEWPQSSFTDWVEKGLYEEGWGKSQEPDNIQKMNFE